jgi:dihydroorotate dehydrogenase
MSALEPWLLAGLARLDPETAHRLTIRALKWGLAPGPRDADDPILRCRLFGHDLPNPIGMAAGFDKDAEVPDRLLQAGFGFVEVGTITPRPQAGNPRPRVFRLRDDGALINRMGFNGGGMAAAAARLHARAGRPGLVGVNIGANKTSADPVADYVAGFGALARFAGYVTANVSSPNTPGLRRLQEKEALERLLDALLAARAAAGLKVPIALKIAPDMTADYRDAIVATALARGIDAIIVSNTTVGQREGLRGAARGETGGLSGKPLLAPSTAMLGAIHRQTRGRLILIGVGGIASGADAYAKIRAGASAVQLYTALTFGGLGLLAAIKRELAARLKADGFASVQAAVGSWDGPDAMLG